MQRRHGLIALTVFGALALGYIGGRTHAPLVGKSVDATISTKGKSASTLAKTRDNPDLGTHPYSSATQPKVSTPLPPPGTPLKQMRVELQARAEAGDAEAASRLYRDTQRCADVRRINATAPVMGRNMLAEKMEGLPPENLRDLSTVLAYVEKQLNFAHDNAALCADLSNDEINQVIPSALQAARLGDMTAADCYVGEMFYASQGLLDHPEWLADYKHNAMAIAQSAIEHGDWRMVNNLLRAYNPINMGIPLLSQLTGHDSAQAYRYLRLRSLGAVNGNLPDYLSKMLAQAAGEISAETKDDADAWAQDAYQRYFSSNPQDKTGSQPENCHSDAGLL